MPQLAYRRVFDAITEDVGEAAALSFRADLMLVLREYARARKWSQAQLGAALGIPQPRVSELLGGKVDKFSSDKLLGMLAKLGIRFNPTTHLAASGELKIGCRVEYSAIG